MESRFLIIPDVHGRGFWKEAVKGNEDKTIVFLGDYHDPYEYEGISRGESYGNLCEIVKFKKEHMDNVILLLGNHDLGYLRKDMLTSRHDFVRERKLRAVFNEPGIFQLIYDVVLDDNRILFSHAGLLPQWISAHPTLFPDGKVDSGLLNEMFQSMETRGQVLDALNEVSVFRGGKQLAGSMVWADIHEFALIDRDGNDPGFIQIVGHTQQAGEHPVGTKSGNVICLDCRKAFFL